MCLQGPSTRLLARSLAQPHAPIRDAGIQEMVKSLLDQRNCWIIALPVEQALHSAQPNFSRESRLLDSKSPVARSAPKSRLSAWVAARYAFAHT
jgi:hypothetical protein